MIVADEETGRLKRINLPLHNVPSFSIGYLLVVFYLFNFIIPFSGLLFMTVKLVQAFRLSAARRQNMTRKKQNEEDITMTLVAVVILFLICQLAIPVRRALQALIPESNQDSGSPFFYVGIILSNLPALNSAINFVFYVMFGRSFRRDFQRVVLRKVNTVNPEGGTQSVTQDTLHLQVSAMSTATHASNDNGK